MRQVFAFALSFALSLSTLAAERDCENPLTKFGMSSKQLIKMLLNGVNRGSTIEEAYDDYQENPSAKTAELVLSRLKNHLGITVREFAQLHRDTGLVVEQRDKPQKLTAAFPFARAYLSISYHAALAKTEPTTAIGKRLKRLLTSDRLAITYDPIDQLIDQSGAAFIFAGMKALAADPLTKPASINLSIVDLYSFLDLPTYLRHEAVHYRTWRTKKNQLFDFLRHGEIISRSRHSTHFYSDYLQYNQMLTFDEIYAYRLEYRALLHNLKRNLKSPAPSPGLANFQVQHISSALLQLFDILRDIRVALRESIVRLSDPASTIGTFRTSEGNYFAHIIYRTHSYGRKASAKPYSQAALLYPMPSSISATLSPWRFTQRPDAMFPLRKSSRKDLIVALEDALKRVENKLTIVRSLNLQTKKFFMIEDPTLDSYNNLIAAFDYVTHHEPEL